MNNNVFVCKYCGKNFIANYPLSSKRILHFCSKSCKTKFQRQGYNNKTQLEFAIKKLIKDTGRYLTTEEIITKMNISSKTLTKFNISTLSLNREMNMKKPQSMFEYYVGIYLEEIFPDLQNQVTFNDCISPKGFLLKFDFYSKLYNVIIEADGVQHKNKNHYFASEYTIECDKIKDRFCKEKNIKLIRIPYTRNVNKDYVIKYCL